MAYNQKTNKKIIKFFLRAQSRVVRFCCACFVFTLAWKGTILDLFFSCVVVWTPVERRTEVITLIGFSHTLSTPLFFLLSPPPFVHRKHPTVPNKMIWNTVSSSFKLRFSFLLLLLLFISSMKNDSTIRGLLFYYFFFLPQYADQEKHFFCVFTCSPFTLVPTLVIFLYTFFFEGVPPPLRLLFLFFPYESYSRHSTNKKRKVNDFKREWWPCVYVDSQWAISCEGNPVSVRSFEHFRWPFLH